MDRKNGNDERNIRKRPIEREGVIYTPSSYEEKDLEKTQVISSKEVRRNIPTATPYTKKVPSRSRGTRARKKKSNYALFFITTIFIGVLVCVFLFAKVIMPMIDTSGKVSGNTEKPSSNTTDEPDITDNNDKTTATAIGIISSIDSEKKSIEVLDAETEKVYILFVDGATELKDKYAQNDSAELKDKSNQSNLVFAELNVGDIVDVQFKKSGNVLTSLQISPLGWEYVGVTKVIVNTEAKSISYGNKKYSYSDNLITKYKNETYDISKVSEVDLVTIRGYKTKDEDKVLFVDVIKRTGVIALEANTDIVEGKVYIDDNDEIELKPREIRVLEGRHQIMVQGLNIEQFSTEMTIDANDPPYKLNLSEVVFNAGTMIFNINEPDAKLTINGETKNPLEPVVLKYGEYKIAVEKDGFNKYEKTVNLETSKLEIDVVLEKILKASEVTITTTPDGASVYVDNQYVGISPLTVPVSYGSHMITIRKDGYIVLEDIPLSVTLETTYMPITLRPLN